MAPNQPHPDTSFSRLSYGSLSPSVLSGDISRTAAGVSMQVQARSSSSASLRNLHSKAGDTVTVPSHDHDLRASTGSCKDGDDVAAVSDMVLQVGESVSVLRPYKADVYWPEAPRC